MGPPAELVTFTAKPYEPDHFYGVEKKVEEKLEFLLSEQCTLDPCWIQHTFYLQEQNQKSTTIEIHLRSILEIMFLMSKGVQVPECHLVSGIAPTNNIEVDWQQVLDGFRILVCDKRPNCASIAVKYRDCWFYLDDRDHNSKTTYLLLKLIFDSEVEGGGAENLPVLTLPL